MKRVRIGWGIFCAVSDIALCIWVCHEWAKVGCEWFSLLLAIIFYTVGALGIWLTVDSVFSDVQNRDNGDIYYKEEDYQ